MLRLVLLGAGTFALGLNTYIMAGLLPSMTQDLGISVGAAGQLISIFTIFYAAGGPVLTALIPARQARSVLLAALALFILGNVATALVRDYWLLMACRAVAGAGAGLYAPFAAAAAAALARPERRGRAMAVITGATSAGTVIGVPLGLAVAMQAGWQSTMWLSAGLGLLAAIGVAFWLRGLPAGGAPSLRARVAVLGDGTVAAMVAVSLLFATGIMGLFGYLAPITGVATSGHEMSVYVSAWGVGGVVGAFGIGAVLDRVGNPHRVLSVLILIVGASVLSLAFLPPWQAGTALALFCWGVAGWSYPVTMQQQLLDTVPEHGPMAVALSSSAVNAGVAIGSALAGLALSLGVPAPLLPSGAIPVTVAGLTLHLTVVRRRRLARLGQAVRPGA